MKMMMENGTTLQDIIDHIAIPINQKFVLRPLVDILVDVRILRVQQEVRTNERV